MHDQDTEQSDDLTHTAWAIIANAANWNMEDPNSLEWRAAAIRWRDRYHDTLTVTAEPMSSDYDDSCNVMMATPVSDDPYFKLKCLELAVASQGSASRTDLVLTKARNFEKYLKGEQTNG